MPDSSPPPPLKVLQTGGLSKIPVFELEFSGGTLTSTSPIRARYVPPGAGGVIYAPTGGNYITFAPDPDLTAEQAFGASTGLSAVSDATTIRMSVNTNVRDKTGGFFLGGNITNNHSATNAFIRIPFNMSAVRIDLAQGTSGSGASLITDLRQYSSTVSNGTSMFAVQADMPAIPVGFFAGSATAFTAINTFYAGSFLGFLVNQSGSTVSGSNLTVTVVARAS